MKLSVVFVLIKRNGTFRMAAISKIFLACNSLILERLWGSRVGCSTARNCSLEILLRYTSPGHSTVLPYSSFVTYALRLMGRRTFTDPAV